MSVVLAAAATTPLPALTTQWISAATAHARFAGPDADATTSGRDWALGHALLRLPHERSVQPLTLPGALSLSADARLDDRASIRTALRAAGHPPPSDADDPQLLAHAYAAWGESMLERVSGDFAFAAWDERRQQLVCACDQIGVVPLHYAVLEDQLLVASSPELLLLHPEVSDELDEGAVADFLLTGYTGSFGATTFAAIRRLPPAHVLIWSSGNLKLRRYWQPPDLEPLMRLSRASDYAESFRELLERVVADRIDPGPLCTHLSGGMDSTTVSAIAHRLRAGAPDDGELRAITIVLGEASGDQEGQYAALVAESMGIATDLIDESKLGSTDPLAPPKLLAPEPTAYPWSDLDVERLAVPARHARTCLTGLGADPLLGFIPWYWAQWLARGEIRRLAVSYWDQARVLHERPRPHLRTAARHLARTRRGADPDIPSWMEASFAAAVDAPDRLRSVVMPASWTRDKRSLTAQPVWQNWFTWADPSYTRFPVRFRHPMADIRLLAFISRIPPYPWLVGKRILRDAGRDLLPPAVLKRPKTLLVGSPRPSSTAQARGALAELIAGVPAAERFIDRAALREAVLDPNPEPWQDWFLTRPLGLVYWLAHR